MAVQIKQREDKLSPDDILSCREPVVMVAYPDRTTCPAYGVEAKTVQQLARLLLLAHFKSPAALVTVYKKGERVHAEPPTLGALAAHRAAGPSLPAALQAQLEA